MVMGRPKGTARPSERFTIVPAEDLANGYDVTWEWTPDRCATCGRHQGRVELLTFRLWSVKHGKWAGHYRLCGKCWERSNEPPDPDPRYADEDAAQAS